ncbi:hypothetical protein [Synechococcus sp. PCC 7336]|uniref:hypothetical protein n=1 Tax=Synechococcus sp. PCC 7336 TaxID=195250 RepID=UPI0012EA51A2|nr:hypothetical protein [Synechococcus sp. PCC 7336]
MPATLLAGILFLGLSIALKVNEHKSLVVEIERDRIFDARVRDAAWPYVMFSFAASAMVGTTALSIAGWRAANQSKTTLAKRQAELELKLAQKNEEIEALRLSPAQLEAIGLTCFMSDAPPVASQSQSTEPISASEAAVEIEASPEGDRLLSGLESWLDRPSLHRDSQSQLQAPNSVELETSIDASTSSIERLFGNWLASVENTAPTDASVAPSPSNIADEPLELEALQELDLWVQDLTAQVNRVADIAKRDRPLDTTPVSPAIAHPELSDTNAIANRQPLAKEPAPPTSSLEDRIASSLSSLAKAEDLSRHVTVALQPEEGNIDPAAFDRMQQQLNLLQVLEQRLQDLESYVQTR